MEKKNTFADDSIALAICDSHSEAFEKIQSMLGQLESWSERNGTDCGKNVLLQ